MKSHRPKTDHAAEMSQFLQSEAELAHIVLDILKDDTINVMAKAPAIAAARYAAEENDLIPDDVPLFGQIDDLYITAIALSDMIRDLGEQGTMLGERKLKDGDLLGGRLTAMQTRFAGFWQYCKKASEPFVKRNRDHYAAHPEQLPELCRTFAKEIEKLDKLCEVPIKLEAREVERFAAQFRGTVEE